MNKKITCEYCGQSDTVKKVLYGMPGEDVDFDRYIIGGFVPDNVLARCIACGWEKLGIPEIFEDTPMVRDLDSAEGYQLRKTSHNNLPTRP